MLERISSYTPRLPHKIHNNKKAEGSKGRLQNKFRKMGIEVLKDIIHRDGTLWSWADQEQTLLIERHKGTYKNLCSSIVLLATKVIGTYFLGRGKDDQREQSLETIKSKLKESQ